MGKGSLLANYLGGMAVDLSQTLQKVSSPNGCKYPPQRGIQALSLIHISEPTRPY